MLNEIMLRMPKDFYYACNNILKVVRGLEWSSHESICFSGYLKHGLYYLCNVTEI